MPNLIIEIGTWKGKSTFQFAQAVKELGLNTKILCIDTWLGGEEHWDLLHPYRRNGNPIGLYNQFIYNVIHNNYQDIIYPMVQSSAVAYSILKKYGITAELIYVDGSHEEPDVFMDLQLYWDLLEIDGLIIGDDFTGSNITGVDNAVYNFAQMIDSQIEVFTTVISKDSIDQLYRIPAFKFRKEK